MFYHSLAKHTSQIAGIEGQQQLSYAQLEQACDRLQLQLANHLGRRKGLVFISVFNGLSSLVAYLSVLRLGHCAMLLSPDTPEYVLKKLVVQYAPNLSIQCFAQQKIEIQFHQSDKSLLNPHVNLLLSTSGTTGTAKQVALSAQNLQANADAICEYLPIELADKTLCSLPFFYSYGLSIINSHLNKGACCVFTDASPVSLEFWQLFENQQINSFAGVPFTYAMLLKLQFNRKNFPHLRYFTQAGGKLDAVTVKTLGEFAEQNHSPFYVMYGQTEASPRMAFLHPSKVQQKPGSIGQAIPKGRFKLVDNNDSEIQTGDQVGELFYSGPNVMLGYTNSLTDLNELASRPLNTDGKWLATGDLAYRDEDGDLFITGRKSRFLKLFGLRVDLDEIEIRMQEQGISGLSTGNDSYLVIGRLLEPNKQEQVDIKSWLSKYLRVHPSVIKVINFDVLPITENGKKDYQTVLKSALDKF